MEGVVGFSNWNDAASKIQIPETDWTKTTEFLSLRNDLDPTLTFSEHQLYFCAAVKSLTEFALILST